MNITQVREKTKSLGIKAGKIQKAELIRQIQVREATFPVLALQKTTATRRTAPSGKTVSVDTAYPAYYVN